MATLEIIWPHKGGIGKTVCAVLLHEDLLARGRKVIGIDSDPENTTEAHAASYKAFDNGDDFIVIHHDIKDDSGVVDAKALDRIPALIKRAHVTDDTTVIIDCGAAGYNGLYSALSLGGYTELTRGQGNKVHFNIIVPTGSDMANVLEKAEELMQEFPCDFAFWLNPVQGGRVEVNGVDFLQSDYFRRWAERIDGIVAIPNSCANTFFKDALRKHFAAGRTMAQNEADASLGYDVQSRVRKFWIKAKAAIDNAKACRDDAVADLAA